MPQGRCFNSAPHLVCLIDRISDTRSQGYISLQSLVKCLDHAQYAVKQSCVRQRDALTCIGMHLQGHNYSNVDLVCLLHVLHTAVYVMRAGCHVPASFCIPFDGLPGQSGCKSEMLDRMLNSNDRKGLSFTASCSRQVLNV